MSYRISLCVGTALVAVGLLLPGSASADSIAINNPSFEAQVFADGGSSGGDGVTDWVTTIGGTGGWVGVFNPTSTHMTDAAGNGTPLGCDGPNILDLWTASGWSHITETVSQVLTGAGNTVQAGTYTLTAAVGYGFTLPAGPDFSFGISTSAPSNLAEYAGLATELTEGRCVDKSVSVVIAPGDVNIGETLEVYVRMTTGAEGLEYFTIFDNVRLDYELAFTLPGDLNGDGFVGGADLDIVRSFWGQDVTPGNKLHGDPSGDGFVGGDDLDEVRAHWGEGTPPATGTVPEPAGLMLILGVIPILCLFRRR